jgi:protein-S-isoprenylcysteine O-methyltransferase Ste14
MHTVELIFEIGWGIFWLYWLVAARSMKRGRRPWSNELRIRLVIVAVAVAVVRLGGLRHHGLDTDLWLEAIGLALFAAGLAFAVWARLVIGRNWGTPMTQKEEPELVKSGPYRLVRHPIYSGIILASVGTAVALSWPWLVLVALIGIYFVYSATIEERFLEQQLPEQYQAYRRTTKMLVPFLL